MPPCRNRLSRRLLSPPPGSRHRYPVLLHKSPAVQNASAQPARTQPVPAQCPPPVQQRPASPGPSAVPAVSTTPAPTTPSGYARAASCSALGQYPAPSGRLPAARSAGRASATGMSAVSGPAGATSATGTVPCAASGATNLRRSSAVCPARRRETCVSASGRGWNAGSAKGTDKFLVVAILAAVIALGAIIYGVITSSAGTPKIDPMELPSHQRPAVLDSIQKQDSIRAAEEAAKAAKTAPKPKR